MISVILMIFAFLFCIFIPVIGPILAAAFFTPLLVDNPTELHRLGVFMILFMIQAYFMSKGCK